MLFKKGYTPWNKGKHSKPRSRETKDKISKTLKGRSKSKETKDKISKRRKEMFKLGLLNVSGKENPNYGNHLSEDAIKKLIQSHTTEEFLKKLLKAISKRPNSFEKKIIDLSRENNLPFKYVGDGEVIIGYKNPDFVETNGRKLLIETYARYWHPKDYEEKRGKLFLKYGFKTLFLNEDDLINKDWKNICLFKIKEFLI